eukprot:scpid93786/ scgid16346/ 
MARRTSSRFPSLVLCATAVALCLFHVLQPSQATPVQVGTQWLRGGIRHPCPPGVYCAERASVPGDQNLDHLRRASIGERSASDRRNWRQPKTDPQFAYWTYGAHMFRTDSTKKCPTGYSRTQQGWCIKEHEHSQGKLNISSSPKRSWDLWKQWLKNRLESKAAKKGKPGKKESTFNPNRKGNRNPKLEKKLPVAQPKSKAKAQRRLPIA